MRVNQLERVTQNRVVALLRDKMGYRYLGDWQERAGHSHIEEALLRDFLHQQGHDKTVIDRALFELNRAAGDQSKSLYENNKAVYSLLRYGVQVKPETGAQTVTVHLVDWHHMENNHFAFAEEVTIQGHQTKRPDVVLYLNGLAVVVLELKRGIVSVSEGIRQNLLNQRDDFIRPFFTTVQLVLAGNDTQGVRYGTIETPEKYYWTWKEEAEGGEAFRYLLDQHVWQLCQPQRLLELMHDFIVFDGGVKKVCRPNQYFGVKAAQKRVHQREGGIVWHTQGSGKSLTMVWLAKWIREHLDNARVLIITDRTELDEQIEKVFNGVNEQIYRAKSGHDLIDKLNQAYPALLASLVHKFGGQEEGDVDGYMAEMRGKMPAGFRAKGNLYIFVDECHRTQSGKLHRGMKEILPDALFIGFTGTPLLKADKLTSLETFGSYIHTYKFDEAVADEVVLDLLYEARRIDQSLTSPRKIDQWFESKTSGLSDLALAQLKKRWGTMQSVLSSKSRLENIVKDIVLDMDLKDRLKSGRGNALLVSDSIYNACKFYELFQQTELRGKCAIITSYKPTVAHIKGEETGEGQTERLHQYNIYRHMLADYFQEDAGSAMYRVEQFEREIKQMFITEPARMKLLIVVDKLLTGFDAPPATYLYIDKPMRDHGLFQAICRVNRLDGDDKEVGYIVDYRDLFKSLKESIEDYTSEAFDGYDKEDVAGLLKDRLVQAKERLEAAREKLKALCEPVPPPKETPEYCRYFAGRDRGDKALLKESEPQRLALYKMTAALIRAYANLANEMHKAGYTAAQVAQIKAEVTHYEAVRQEVKLYSGDQIDLKLYEPAMRHLLDAYIRAEESEMISAFENATLVELLVAQGEGAIEKMPAGIRQDKGAVAETIENNIRKVIVDEQPINPKYYERMSELLDTLIEQRKADALDYESYLAKIVELSKQVKNPARGGNYPAGISTPALQALYDTLEQDADTALTLDQEIRTHRQDGWRGNRTKERMVRNVIRRCIGEEKAEYVFKVVKEQDAY